MKIGLGISTLALAALVQLSPAFAASVPDKTERLAVVSGTEFSADEVKKKRVRYVRERPVQIRRPGWTAADPSFGPDGRLYPRPTNMGDCVIDMGYGRWAGCNNR